MQKFGGSLQSSFVNKFKADLQRLQHQQTNKTLASDSDSSDSLERAPENTVGNATFSPKSNRPNSRAEGQ
jgi:hypothetical protein